MRFSIGVFPTESKESAQKVIEAVQEAEAAGFDRAWIVDSQGLFRDVYVTLTLCAERTKRIGLGTAVTNSITRHLSVTARAVATLDEIWPGRILLGIGAGDTSMKYLRRPPLAAEKCEDAVHCIRSLISGKDGVFDGEQIDRFVHHQERDIPIYLAANGPKMLRVAGRCANGVIASTGVTPRILQYVKDSLEQGMREVGRKPGDVEILLHVGCDISGDRKSARNNVKSYVARRVLAPLPRSLSGFSEKDVQTFRAAYSLSGHLQAGASHSDLVKDEWIDRFALAGDSEECLDKLMMLQEQGLDEVFVLPITASSIELIRKFAEKIFPRFH